MSNFELTNMIMVYDPKTNKAVVERRVKYWCGISFPGGHIEPGESFYDSAIREVKEETGLTVSNLKLCGIINWYNNVNGDRYLVYCYKTDSFAGDLLDSTEEGKVFWADIDKIKEMDLAPNFKDYLDLFLSDGICEIFSSWNDDEENHDLIFK
jgi:8-oxo-dGTP diphosphatase